MLDLEVGWMRELDDLHEIDLHMLPHILVERQEISEERAMATVTVGKFVLCRYNQL